MTVFHLQSFETKSINLVDTKYGHGALLGMPYKGPKRGLKVRKFDRQPGLLNKITKNSAKNPQNPTLLTNVKVKIFKTDLNNDNRVPCYCIYSSVGD